MADLLATSIQVSGLSEEELELRLGWTSGSISRILEGEEDLDPDEAIRVLSELNGDPGLDGEPDLADREDGHTQVVTNLLERFHRLGYEARPMEALEEDLDVAKLEEKIQAILREAFGNED
ncbi:MAG: hypothetical protein QOH06_5465 [Acidobacteriota bacterium]|jgi:transcriptional regulator with XRE-family HTH domain|nr:hypothetical protein [Acidobacteriota bacterium]